MAKVAAVTKEAVEYLAGRKEPLTSTLKQASVIKQHGSGRPGGRKVSLGTVPDFAFGGPGVRITGTAPGSPAEKAGLQADDVVVKIGDDEVKDLRGLELLPGAGHFIQQERPDLLNPLLLDFLHGL